MKKIIYSFFFITFISTYAFAGNGDTTHVVTHNHAFFVTNPSTGANPYPAWGVFPPDSVKSRKIILTLTYSCPQGAGLQCGAWDYIDWVYIRRLGGMNAPSKDLEIARYITPYGQGYSGSNWQAAWHIDVTDYASLLHDSVEIEYQHTGYETNVNVGWIVTVDFTVIEGTPAVEPISITQLWNGNFEYGNAANPIENNLKPDTLIVDPNADLLRLRLLQSGHGSDATGCSEFCDKIRYVYFDNTFVSSRHIWRVCGTNALYPESGTWIYDRANWCPGAMVYPDVYDFHVIGGSQHILNIDMQPYTISNPSARFAIDGQVIQYKAPAFVNDASIDEVITPNTIFEYGRMNPVCDNPKIIIRNNGSAPLTSAVIAYGIEGVSTYSYNWSGSIATQQSDTVTLGNIILPSTNLNTFKAYLAAVNGASDQYNFDDTIRTTASIPLTYDSTFIILFKTNNESYQNYYQLIDHNGNIVYQRTAGSLANNIIYRDTLHLTTGCYKFKFYDTGGDGLSFWNNAPGGSGYLRFMGMGGNLLKFFNPDFGSEAAINFTVNPAAITTLPVITNDNLYAEVYPNPTKGKVNVDLWLPVNEEITVTVQNVLGAIQLAPLVTTMSNGQLQLDLSNHAAGMYFIHLSGDKINIVKRVLLEK